MAADIWQQLKTRQEAVEAALAEALAAGTADAPPILVEAMGYSLLAPGKRLRPILCILACEACGGTLEQALPAASAVEMIHAYSLIHDDLPAMDDDDLRRGLPTSHKKFGEALAILAGDALQALAFQTLHTGYGPPEVSVICLELAKASGAAGMVGGQVLDMVAEAGDKVELEAIHRKKTGALFRAAMLMGMTAARSEWVKTYPFDYYMSLTTYATAFGLLFQVTDDLLDVEGSAETTGKAVNKDAGRGKLTYPGLLGVEASRAKAKALADEAIWAAGTFGERGELLAGLARFVLHRDR